jgi:hypothetical protein
MNAVMAGLVVPAIHAFLHETKKSKTWMPGTSGRLRPSSTGYGRA